MFYHIFLCVVGATMQEVFHWLQLRVKLTPEEFIEQRKSKWTWALSGFVILIVVPSMAFIWFDGPSGAATGAKNYFMFGAGLPLILKSGLGASLASDNLVRLGPTDALRTYLGLRR